MGRPTKLTPELQDRMVQIIRAGNYQVVACRYVGLAERTFYYWLSRGRRGWKIDEPYVQFLQAIEEAQAAAEIESVARIRAAARKGDLDSDKFFLTHAYPDRWGRHQARIEHSGMEGKPIIIRVVYEDAGN
jgi:hypothetical protein